MKALPHPKIFVLLEIFEMHTASLVIIIVRIAFVSVAQWLAHLPLVLEVLGSILAAGEENFGVQRAFLSHKLVSFAGITLNKSPIL